MRFATPFSGGSRSLRSKGALATNWHHLNYIEKKFSKSDYLSLRDEYFDDIRGQRTSTKTKYTEHMSS